MLFSIHSQINGGLRTKQPTSHRIPVVHDLLSPTSCTRLCWMCCCWIGICTIECTSIVLGIFNCSTLAVAVYARESELMVNLGFLGKLANNEY